MSKFFNEIVAPQLTQADYGQGIESMVNNINANFQKVFTLPFLKGDDGDRLTTRFCPFWDSSDPDTAKLTEEGYKIFKTIFIDDKIKNGIEFTNTKPGCTLETLMGDLAGLFTNSENSGETQFENTYGPAGNPKILLYYQIDTESNNETLLGAAQLYYFFDSRIQGLSDFIGVNDTKTVEGFVDYTCILSTKYVNGDQEYSYEYEKQSGWPTLYFDSSSKQFCWQINGQKTGVNAQGVNGRDGRGSKIWLCVVKPTTPTEAGQTMSTNVDYSKGKYAKFEITDIWVPKLNEWLNINEGEGYKKALNALGESGMPSSGDLFIAYLYSAGDQSIEVPVYTIVNGEWVKSDETEIFNKPPMSIYGTLFYDAQANDDKKYYVFSNISQNLYRTTDNTVLVDMLNHIGDYTGDNSSASNGVQDPMCITKGLFVPLRDTETTGNTHKYVHVLYNDRDNGSLNLKVDALANVVDVHESHTDVNVDKEKKNLNIIYNTNVDGILDVTGVTILKNNVSIKGTTTIGDNIIPNETNKFSLGTDDKKFKSIYSHNIIGTFDSGSNRGIYGLKWDSGDLHFITSKNELNKPYIYVYENSNTFTGKNEYSHRMSLLSQNGVRIYKNIYIGVPTGGSDTSIDETAKMNINSSTGDIYTSGKLGATGAEITGDGLYVKATNTQDEQSNYLKKSLIVDGQSEFEDIWSDNMLCDNLHVYEDAMMYGDLTVDGAATLKSTLSVTGATTLGATSVTSLTSTGDITAAGKSITAGQFKGVLNGSIILKEKTDSSNYPMIFASGLGDGENGRSLYTNSTGFAYNPSTNTLTVSNITGTVTNSKRLRYIAYTKNSGETTVNPNGNDLDVMLRGGGITYQYYGEGSSWFKNAPSNCSYNSVINFCPWENNTGDFGNLQLCYDWVHQKGYENDSTKDLWYRTSNGLFKGAKWRKIVAYDNGDDQSLNITGTTTIQSAASDGNKIVVDSNGVAINGATTLSGDLILNSKYSGSSYYSNKIKFQRSTSSDNINDWYMYGNTSGQLEIGCNRSDSGEEPLLKLGRSDNDTKSMEVNASVTAKVNNIENVSLGVPVGSIMMWSGTSLPYGWLYCDGSNIDFDKRKGKASYQGRNLTIGGIKFTNDTYAELITLSKVICYYKSTSGDDYTDNEGYCYIGRYGYGTDSSEHDYIKLPDLQSRFPLGKSSSYSLGSTGGSQTHTHKITDNPEIKVAGGNYNITTTGDDYQGRVLVSGTKKNSYSDVSFTNSDTSNIPPYLVVYYIIKYK